MIIKMEVRSFRFEKNARDLITSAEKPVDKRFTKQIPEHNHGLDNPIGTESALNILIKGEISRADVIKRTSNEKKTAPSIRGIQTILFMDKDNLDRRRENLATENEMSVFGMVNY